MRGRWPRWTTAVRTGTIYSERRVVTYTDKMEADETRVHREV